MSKYIIEAIHWLISVVIFVVALVIFSGCTPKTITQYEQVYIPIKCDVNIPQKPNDTKDEVKNNLLIINYVKQLEQALKRCM